MRIIGMTQSLTFYELIGEEALAELVKHFYELVYSDERINHLFQNDIEEVKDKQFRFLCQFLGGPSYYSEKYGHPRMRMRHMPHKISTDSRDAWLENMQFAIQKTTSIPDELKTPLYNCFPKLANHMVNT